MNKTAWYEFELHNDSSVDLVVKNIKKCENQELVGEDAGTSALYIDTNTDKVLALPVIEQNKFTEDKYIGKFAVDAMDELIIKAQGQVIRFAPC